MGSFGKIAHDAYFEFLTRRAGRGFVPPEWNSESAETRDAWEAAASAVLKMEPEREPSDEHLFGTHIREAVLIIRDWIRRPKP